jgi:hypothetical protein
LNKGVAIVLAASVAAGCAVVEKVNFDGTVERSTSFFAPVSVVVGSPEGPRAVRASGIGVGVGPDSAVLGAYEIAAVHLDAECRIVVMPHRDVELENFRRFMEQTPNVCGDTKLRRGRH